MKLPYRNREDALEHQIKMLCDKLNKTKEELNKTKEKLDGRGFKISPFIFYFTICFICIILFMASTYFISSEADRVGNALLTSGIVSSISGAILAFVLEVHNGFKY